MSGPRVMLDQAFEVELAQTGGVLQVAADDSLLHVLLENGVDMDFACEAGICGTCETDVLAGRVDHRDSLLSPDERDRHDVIFPCVSRAACDRLVLDL